jgi:pimeloyl-ACP methyl ester carboxylesterase
VGDKTVLLLGAFMDTWKHVTHYLTGMDVVIDGEGKDQALGYAVVGHGIGGREAQSLALDGGARALVLINCEILSGREGDLGALTIPVFLLWGEDDSTNTIETAYLLNELMPTSTLAIVPGCGSQVPLEAPDVVGPLIADFLRTRWLGLAREHAHDHDHAQGRSSGEPVQVDIEREPPQGV